MSNEFIAYELECAERALDRGDDKAYEELMVNVYKVEWTMFINAMDELERLNVL